MQYLQFALSHQTMTTLRFWRQGHNSPIFLRLTLGVHPRVSASLLPLWRRQLAMVSPHYVAELGQGEVKHDCNGAAADDNVSAPSLQGHSEEPQISICCLFKLEHLHFREMNLNLTIRRRPLREGYNSYVTVEMGSKNSWVP